MVIISPRLTAEDIEIYLKLKHPPLYPDHRRDVMRMRSWANDRIKVTQFGPLLPKDSAMLDELAGK